MGNNYWRERSLPYQPGQATPFKVSRSKIELFKQCPRCFWLDVRLKIKRPEGPPFNINKAIDELFKKEFDAYRARVEAHPLMLANGVEAVPFAHDKLDEWRDTFVGVQHRHELTNLLVFGGVDDVWVNNAGELIIVDYKATSKDKEVSINAGWQISYKRQMEVYQWLFRRNGFAVAPVGYFVYANGRADLDGFFDRVEFKTKLIPYEGNDAWIEPTLLAMKKCMDSDEMPGVGESIMGGECEFCAYARERAKLTLAALRRQGSSVAAR